MKLITISVGIMIIARRSVYLSIGLNPAHLNQNVSGR
jgi:hypothetical protein